VTEVTDAGGRSFTIAYFTKDTAKKPQIRGKVASITDHVGRQLQFQYYDDGNLLRIVDHPPALPSQPPLDNRSWVFTYTTSNGAGPAIPNAADRVNPDPSTPNQSTSIYSARDPLGHETLYSYNGPGSSRDRGKVATVTDRAGATTMFSYDINTQVTTVAAPAPTGQTPRTTAYTYDTSGKVTKVHDALQRDTLVEWSPDFAVTPARDRI